MTRDPRKEAIKAQRIAADSAARARSYLGALTVYRPGCVPAELRAEAARLQERAAVAYSDSIRHCFIWRAYDLVQDGLLSGNWRFENVEVTLQSPTP